MPRYLLAKPSLLRCTLGKGSDLQCRIAARGARFLYLLPNFQNPSGRCLSAARRNALADKALANGLPLVCRGHRIAQGGGTVLRDQFPFLLRGRLDQPVIRESLIDPPPFAVPV